MGRRRRISVGESVVLKLNKSDSWIAKNDGARKKCVTVKVKC